MKVPAVLIVSVLLGLGSDTSRPGPDASHDGIGVLTAVAPQFPEAAAQAAISKRFIVHVDVGADGVPTNARMEPPFVVFQRAVEAAANAWRFTPADSPTQPLRKVDLVFDFKILPKASAPGEAVTVFRPPYEIEIRRQATPLPDGPTIH